MHYSQVPWRLTQALQDQGSALPISSHVDKIIILVFNVAFYLSLTSECLRLYQEQQRGNQKGSMHSEK